MSSSLMQLDFRIGGQRNAHEASTGENVLMPSSVLFKKDSKQLYAPQAANEVTPHMTLDVDDDADYYEEESPVPDSGSQVDPTQNESVERSEDLEFPEGCDQDIPQVKDSGQGQILQTFEMDATDMLAAAARRLRGYRYSNQNLYCNVEAVGENVLTESDRISDTARITFQKQQSAIRVDTDEADLCSDTSLNDAAYHRMLNRKGRSHRRKRNEGSQNPTGYNSSPKLQSTHEKENEQLPTDEDLVPSDHRAAATDRDYFPRPAKTIASIFEGTDVKKTPEKIIPGINASNELQQLKKDENARAMTQRLIASPSCLKSGSKVHPLKLREADAALKASPHKQSPEKQQSEVAAKQAVRAPGLNTGRVIKPKDIYDSQLMRPSTSRLLESLITSPVANQIDQNNLRKLTGQQSTVSGKALAATSSTAAISTSGPTRTQKTLAQPQQKLPSGHATSRDYHKVTTTAALQNTSTVDRKNSPESKQSLQSTGRRHLPTYLHQQSYLAKAAATGALVSTVKSKNMTSMAPNLVTRQAPKTTGKHQRISSTSSAIGASSSQWKSSTQVVNFNHIYSDNAAWPAGAGPRATRARKQSLHLLDSSVDSKTSLRLRQGSGASPHYPKNDLQSAKKLASAASKKLESSFKVQQLPSKFDHTVSSPVRPEKKPKLFETVQKDRSNIDDDEDDCALLQTTYKISKATRKRASVSKSHKKFKLGASKQNLSGLESNQRSVLAKSVYEKTASGIEEAIEAVIGQGLVETNDDALYQDCEVVDDEDEHHSIEQNIGESVRRESLLDRLTGERVETKPQKKIEETSILKANLSKKLPVKRTFIRNKRQSNGGASNLPATRTVESLKEDSHKKRSQQQNIMAPTTSQYDKNKGYCPASLKELLRKKPAQASGAPHQKKKMNPAQLSQATKRCKSALRQDHQYATITHGKSHWDSVQYGDDKNDMHKKSAGPGTFGSSSRFGGHRSSLDFPNRHHASSVLKGAVMAQDQLSEVEQVDPIHEETQGNVSAVPLKMGNDNDDEIEKEMSEDQLQFQKSNNQKMDGNSSRGMYDMAAKQKQSNFDKLLMFNDGNQANAAPAQTSTRKKFTKAKPPIAVSSTLQLQQNTLANQFSNGNSSSHALSKGLLIPAGQPTYSHSGQTPQGNAASLGMHERLMNAATAEETLSEHMAMQNNIANAVSSSHSQKRASHIQPSSKIAAAQISHLNQHRVMAASNFASNAVMKEAHTRVKRVKTHARGDRQSMEPVQKFRATASNNMGVNKSTKSSQMVSVKNVYGSQIGNGSNYGFSNGGDRHRNSGVSSKVGSHSLVRQNMNNFYGQQKSDSYYPTGNNSGSGVRLQNHKTPIYSRQSTMPGGSQSMIQPKERKQNFVSLLQPLEKEKFGDRTPAGFRKLDLLGRGGIALVWLAEVKDPARLGYEIEQIGMKVALKQFPKVKGRDPIDGSARIEIEIGNTMFPLELKDGCSGDHDTDYERGCAVDEAEFPGIKSIAKLIDTIEDSKDFWLVYEVGSKCLGKHLTEVKGEFYKGERIYRVQHQTFYEMMIRDWRVLRTFIRKLAEAFDVLSNFGIVHSDIKPDNILVEMNENYTDIKQVKLIDFGSAFEFHNVTQITSTTPEYLAPEILEFLETRQNMQCKTNMQQAISLNKRACPWSFDVWSLGIILLEIVSGCPVWMSLKCRIATVDGKSTLGSGLLGVQGREQKRIIVKQQQVFKNLNSTLKKFECYGLDKDGYFMDLLQRMLSSDPSTRISPQEILQHPFVRIQ